MRRFFTLLFVVISIHAWSQAEDENFYLLDSKIFWRKAFPTEKPKDDIFRKYLESKVFDKIELIDDRLVGVIKPHQVDEKKTGVAGVPPIVNKPDFIANVIIEYRSKEKDYVISMSDILLVGTGEIIKKKEKQPFELHYLKKGITEYRPYFLKRPMKVYNITFSEIFEF